jgi:hypothetical protein
MSGPTFNQPAQPSYGEGMAEALKAQAEFLKGTGDFADVGSLESLLPLEQSIREKTAQADTDILRQTLLGEEREAKVVRTPDGRFGIPDGEVVMSSSGPSAGQYQMISQPNGSFSIMDTSTGGILPEEQTYEKLGYVERTGQTSKWDRKNDGMDATSFTEYKLTPAGEAAGIQLAQGGRLERPQGEVYGSAGSVGILTPSDQSNTFGINNNPGARSERGGQVDAQAEISNVFNSLNTATPTEIQTTFEFENPYTGEPLEEGQTITIREGDGMVDILGDRRAVQEFDTKIATQADVDAKLADEVGDTFVTQRDTTRQAGFDDQGQFQGLAAMAEDIQRGNLSRQREADLQDVSRLSGLYQDIMGDYKPGTQTAMQGAKDLIEEQKGNLLRDVGISDPEKVASQGVQADPLRQGLMTQAQEALGQGLTEREERQIAEAARARSTLMGRTFDQSAAIDEAEARVLEDNQRKMQNRAFAQSVLGQEAGIQTADDTRAMGADQFNVGTKMDSERLRESLRMQGLLGYLDAASGIQQMEDRDSLDPFQAILGRGGGTALQQGQSVFGQAGYGLQSSPQYLNPEAGLGFIQNQATNAANMAIADQAARASSQAGIFSGIGSAIGGGLTGYGAFKCWVAREVYGAHNPSWLLFRNWLDTKAPRWFDKLYIKFGERFAKFISNKPRLKARIRIWMDSKIRR